MNQHQNEGKFKITFQVNSEDRLVSDESNRKILGYAALSKIYHELDIHTFLKNRQRHSKSDYDANNIMKLLVYSRLLYPGSKKKAFENKHIFFENTNFSLDDISVPILFSQT